jgi:hypothetical protein
MMQLVCVSVCLSAAIRHLALTSVVKICFVLWTSNCVNFWELLEFPLVWCCLLLFCVLCCYSVVHVSSQHFTSLSTLHCPLTIYYTVYTSLFSHTSLSSQHFTSLSTLHFPLNISLPSQHFTTPSTLDYPLFTSLSSLHFTTLSTLHYPLL